MPAAGLLDKNTTSCLLGYFGKLAGEEHAFRFFFQMGLAWSNRASCCNRLAAKGMDTMQLAAETEVSVTVQTFS